MNKHLRKFFLILGIILPILSISSGLLFISMYSYNAFTNSGNLGTIIFGGLNMLMLLGTVGLIIFSVKVWLIYKDFNLYKNSPVSNTAALILFTLGFVYCGFLLANCIIIFDAFPYAADYIRVLLIMGFVFYSLLIIISLIGIIYTGMKKFMKV